MRRRGQWLGTTTPNPSMVWYHARDESEVRHRERYQVGGDGCARSPRKLSAASFAEEAVATVIRSEAWRLDTRDSWDKRRPNHPHFFTAVTGHATP